MKYIVYQTTNIINNKIYIGVHKVENPDVFDGYLGCGVYIHSPSSYMYPTTPFQYAVKKYGISKFKRTTIKVFDNLQEAFNLEKELVNYEFLNRKDTYNAALGGGGGNQAFVSVCQFTLEGKFIKKWKSIIEASEFIGVYHTAICRAVKEKGSCKKFFWALTEDININEYSCGVGTVCYKYDAASGKCVDIYNSLTEASKDANTYLSTMERAVKGGYKVGNYYYSTKLLEEYYGKPKVSLKNKVLYVYDLDGNFIIELHTSSEICQYFNIKSTNAITTSLRLERPYKQWQFSLTKEETLPKVINKKNIKKRIGRYTLGGDLIEVFESIESAKKIWGSGVQRTVRGQQKQCKGYLFKLIS